MQVDVVLGSSGLNTETLCCLKRLEYTYAATRRQTQKNIVIFAALRTSNGDEANLKHILSYS